MRGQSSDGREFELREVPTQLNAEGSWRRLA